jgi:SAM-dependent MidA family methyltransferase
MPATPPVASDAEPERVARVVERLRSLADPSGFVPFDRFMDTALYAEGIGYYSAARSPLGLRGDFYTAAHVTPLFAATIAQRIRVARRELGADSPFRVVELGPGDGTLAAGVLRALTNESRGVEYTLVDRSAARAREAVDRTRAVAGSIPVKVAGSLADDGPFAGVVLANEFLDAQPARRLRWDGTRWHELGVRVEPDRVVAAESDDVPPVPGAPLPVPTEPEVTVEISPGSEAIVREIADHLTAGAAILIDYGLEETELLGGHPRGTLAAVRNHRSVPDPLEGPGTSDLSVFVNFSRVRAAARAAGLSELAYRSQAEALGAWGFPALLEAAVRTAGSSPEEVRVRLAAKNLLFGFDRFRVLELAPGRPPTT